MAGAMDDRARGKARGRRAVVTSVVAALAIGLGACTSGSGGSRPPSGSATSTSQPSVSTSSRPNVATTTTGAAAATSSPTSSPTTSATTSTTSTTSSTTSTTPTTSTTSPTSTTTAVAPTTTTTSAPPPPSSSGTSPWVWVVLAVVLVAVIVTVLVLALRRRNRLEAEATWRRQTAGVLDGARLARELLPASGRDIPDPVRWQVVRDQVEAAAVDLERAAASAPAPDAAGAAGTTADALRNLVFALEADRLLRDGTRPPTPEALAQADATCRARAAELDAGLARLDALVHPAPADAPGPGPASPGPAGPVG